MHKILTDLSIEKLAYACESNMREWYSRKLASSENDLKRENELLWSYSPSRNSYPGLGNNIPFPRFKRREADRLLEKMLTYYNRRSADCWCTCGHSTTPQHVRQSLRSRGFVFRLPNIGMACRLSRINSNFRTPRGLETTLIHEIKSLRTFEHPSYGSLEVRSNKKAMKASLVYAEKYPHQVYNFLASIEEVPVGYAMLNISHGVAGIYEVGVTRQMQRKNIGSAVVLAACKKAMELGYKAAVLQSNAGLRSLYQRLGFREVTTIEYWLYSHKANKRRLDPIIDQKQAQTSIIVEQFLTALLTDKQAQAIKILSQYPNIARIPFPGFGNTTALHIAAWNGFSDCVRCLIDLGAPLEARDMEYKGTPLHWAVHGLGQNGPILKRDQVGAARHLLKAGAKAFTVNKWNISPLYLAKKSMSKPMILLLESNSVNTYPK